MAKQGSHGHCADPLDEASNALTLTRTPLPACRGVACAGLFTPLAVPASKDAAAACVQ